MNKPKIVVTRRWPDEVETCLRDRFEAVLNPEDRAMSSTELQNALREADALLPTVTDQISADVLNTPGKRAKIVASYGVGFNHIDLEAAKAAGLIVTNTPEILTDCTADLAMTLLLMVARRASEGERHVRAGAWTGWRPTHMMASAVTGKTLGLIGMGRIARAVARRAAHGFDMRIIFHDPVAPDETLLQGLNAKACESSEAVLEQADFVSLHCPGGKATYHLIGAKAFKKMRSDAFLINTARGDVVDDNALIEALQAGEIAGAGLDVFENEPHVSPELLTMENVVLLPHLGSASRETRVAMGMRVIENLDAFFAGEIPRDKLV
jgi:lactate dehydrogenase-like 2-hydroxyacid dehydrogenase